MNNTNDPGQLEAHWFAERERWLRDRFLWLEKEERLRALVAEYKKHVEEYLSEYGIETPLRSRMLIENIEKVLE